ncbi:prostaglandin E synthase [Pundamilia nyererei]|uniref:Prostaglandin E synthase n=1 Tax=Pundamilia nyererei TaxID=303518 RepID=A0A9Y3QTD2_9CICH|nr:PREDICTED: prostaglandin E synthase [Pundamilia nyererei]
MLRNSVFSCFVFYGVLLVLKMYVIAVITGQIRLRKKAFANPEDALRHGGLQYHREDPYVERCRRACAPTRSVAYTLAQIPCVSMAVQILMAVKSYA